MFFSHFSPLELARLDALIAAIASFLTCLLLVGTKKWHGAFSMDSSTGVQKFHTAPTPRIAGIALVVGVLARHSERHSYGRHARLYLWPAGRHHQKSLRQNPPARHHGLWPAGLGHYRRVAHQR